MDEMKVRDYIENYLASIIDSGDLAMTERAFDSLITIFDTMSSGFMGAPYHPNIRYEIFLDPPTVAEKDLRGFAIYRNLRCGVDKDLKAYEKLVTDGEKFADDNSLVMYSIGRDGEMHFSSTKITDEYGQEHLITEKEFGIFSEILREAKEGGM